MICKKFLSGSIAVCSMLIMATLISCQKKTNRTYSPVTEKRVSLDSVNAFIIDPRLITGNDDYIILHDQSMAPAIHILDSRQFSYLQGVGGRGGGNGEFRHMSSLSYDSENDVFFAVDPALKRISVLTNDGMLNTLMPFQSESVILQLRKYNEFFLGNGGTQNNLVHVFNESGDFIESFIPPIEELDPDTYGGFVQGLLNMNFSTEVNKDEIMALAFRNYSTIWIVNVGDRNYIKAETPFSFINDYQIMSTPGGPQIAFSNTARYGYINVCSNDDFIVGMYSGKLRNLDIDEYPVKSLHIFDWDGKLVKMIETDHAYSGCVLSKRGQLSLLGMGADGSFLGVIQL